MSMASSSTSSIPKSFKYDVFLSFRGEDTRRNLVDHLYHALVQQNIETYKDDENMVKGERISDELIKAIEDSRFYVIVFSKNYASSSWCLDELVKIMEECQKTTDHTTYPVFYDVEPTEVRKQCGAVGEAFAKCRRMDEDAGKWRKVLEEATRLDGFVLNNTANGHEAQFIKEIVKVISQKLNSINFIVDEKLVGLERRIKDVVSSSEFGFGFDDVRMIGIKGIGGGGKTTLARAIFNQISHTFEGKSFVNNVREVSKSSLSGLKSLQEQILSNVLGQKITVNDVDDGKKMMKRKMCGRKVLVVLDDVDDMDQLVALADEPNWFKAGSRIIITTRNEQVLVAHGVDLIYYVNLLSDEEAIQLFNKFALKKKSPIQGYEELSGKAVRYAAGLPLTIKVLGAFLCGKKEDEWKDALDKLKTFPLEKTLQILELSYIGLDDHEKEIFLDVATILKGWRKDDAIKVLESCNSHAIIGLKVLEEKSLITISKDGHLEMHDHIQEMGRHIVRRSYPDEPHRHSRLWIDKEIMDIFANDLGNKATRCLKLSTRVGALNLKVVLKGLENMKKLRFLHMTSNAFDVGRVQSFDEVSQCFPNVLQFLHWTSYPFRCLPKQFQANNLVGLEIPCSNIELLWEGGEKKVLNKLRFLDLSLSKLRTFDLGLTPNLEILSLSKCTRLEELRIPIGCPKLKSLDLRYSKLRTVDLCLVSNLEMLSLARCGDLVELHMPVRCLKLRSLDISHSMLRTLDLRLAPNLEKLITLGCYYLVEFHMPIECLRLKEIILDDSKLRTLDLGLTPNLQLLNLMGSSKLVELHMRAQCLKLKSLNLSHSKLRTLDLRPTPNLEWLSLEQCSSLVELHAPVGYLEKLRYLNLSGCSRFNYLSFDKDLSFMRGSSIVLHLTVKYLGTCPLHSDYNLPTFVFTHSSSSFGIEKVVSVGVCACTNLESFSRSICGLQCLRELTLEGEIRESPKDLGQLQCLEKLTFRSTMIEHLPNSICMLKNLISLEVESCLLLEKLPEDLDRLECLTMLSITGCRSLRDIPNNICKMKRLTYFHLSYCKAIEKLPEELGNLECLAELNIEGTNISHLPLSILLSDIRIVRWPKAIEEELGNLECLAELNIDGTNISHLPPSIFLERIHQALPDYVPGEYSAV